MSLVEVDRPANQSNASRSSHRVENEQRSARHHRPKLSNLVWPWRLVVWFLNGPAVYMMVGVGALADGHWASEWLDDRPARTDSALLVQARQVFADSARPADEARRGLAAMRGKPAKAERVWSMCADLAAADYGLLVVVLDEDWPASLRPYHDELAAALATEQTAATDCAQERDEQDLTAAIKKMDRAAIAETVAIVRAALRLPPADGGPLDDGTPSSDAPSVQA